MVLLPREGWRITGNPGKGGCGLTKPHPTP